MKCGSQSNTDFLKELSNHASLCKCFLSFDSPNHMASKDINCFMTIFRIWTGHRICHNWSNQGHTDYGILFQWSVLSTNTDLTSRFLMLSSKNWNHCHHGFPQQLCKSWVLSAVGSLPGWRMFSSWFCKCWKTCHLYSDQYQFSYTITETIASNFPSPDKAYMSLRLRHCWTVPRDPVF